MSQRIFFSVGEPSGDQHTARLIRRLRERRDDIALRGFGGPEMADAGCRLDLELTSHAVVGFLKVLPKLREFFGFVDDAEAIFRRGEVDAVVLVDFPGFNWHIAKRARRHGIPVFYYCPPQLWAWGAWRVKKMRASVDHVLAVLPIEERFFSRHGIPSTFVGHPFFDAVSEQTLNQPFVESLRRQKTVAVLPGSRTHEVRDNWPIMLTAIRSLADAFPDVRFAVAAYRDKHAQFCRDQFTESDRNLPIAIHQGVTSEIIEGSHCAMMVSGSVSLELMARRTPATVLYRVGRFLHTVGRHLVKVRSVTLPNLMWDEAIQDGDGLNQPTSQWPFPEHVSVGDPEPAAAFLVDSVGRMLDDEAFFQQKRSVLAALNEQFVRPGASGRAADALLDLLANRNAEPQNAAA